MLALSILMVIAVLAIALPVPQAEAGGRRGPSFGELMLANMAGNIATDALYTVVRGTMTPHCNQFMPGCYPVTPAYYPPAPVYYPPVYSQPVYDYGAIRASMRNDAHQFGYAAGNAGHMIQACDRYSADPELWSTCQGSWQNGNAYFRQRMAQGRW